MKTTNRISHHFTDAEFLHALERTGAVKIEPVPHSLTPVEPRGQLAVPEFDYATNTVHGSLKDDGLGCDDEPVPHVPEVDVSGVCFAVCLGCVMGLVLWALVGSVVWRVLR